jgi:hypothetical protein
MQAIKQPSLKKLSHWAGILREESGIPQGQSQFKELSPIYQWELTDTHFN